MKEEWLFPNAAVPVDTQTTLALLVEIKRLIDVVGGLVLKQGPDYERGFIDGMQKQMQSSVDRAVNRMAQQEQGEPVAWMTITEYGEEDDIHYENPEGHLLEGWTYRPLYTHPPSVQPVKLRRGDILRCIETDELCTVWSTSTTGKTLVKWSANNFGDYTAEQIGELFWLEPKQEQEPVAWMWDVNNGGGYTSKGIGFMQTNIPFAKHTPLFTTPPQRTEQNFCSRCGKRTPDLITIHTCTPPKENT